MTSPNAGLSRPGLEGARREWVRPFDLGAWGELPFGEAIARVEAALRLGIDPSLEPVRALLAELGHPERAFACIQVAGTNGKTSTSRYTAALLAGEGLRCGLYTSPHLVSYTERVEVGGAPVTEAAFSRGIGWALAAWERLQARGEAVCAQGCTEFELLTAAAMAMFAEAGVDAAVLEVGLGGRWDATSAVDTVAAAVTGIGFDHMGILGDTLEEIAGEKAAVLRPGIPCVLGTNAVRPQSVLDVMLARCAQVGAVPTAVVEAPDARAAGERCLPGASRLPQARFRVLETPGGLGGRLVVDVEVEVDHPACGRVSASYPGCALHAPVYQAQNVACALALATGALGRPLDAGAARRALAACPVPGRFEVVRTDPPVVLDACHNPQSAAAFADAVADAEPDRAKRPALVLGALADKDHRGIVETVAPLFERIVATQSDSPRALPAAELAAEVERAVGRRPEAVFPRAADAVAYLEGEPFVGCGTITLVGELKALLAR